MSEERDSQTAGAPVEETEATQTDVLAAVERATEASAAESTPASSVSDEGAAQAAPSIQMTDEQKAASSSIERPVIAPVTESPSAAPGPTAGEIFAAATPNSGVQQADGQAMSESVADPAAQQAAALAERLQSDAAAADAVAGPAAVVAQTLAPVRDGEIRISADHPMAALYMQTPMPPEIRGNRGAGILIALLATVGFALVFAGIIALTLAPVYPPSTFLTEGLLPSLLTWNYLGSIAAFFVGLALLVLISGRAGWWAYVIGGFPVGILVFIVAFLGTIMDSGEEFRSSVSDLLAARLGMGALVAAIIAGVLARETTVWFGAWIGSRGRKITRKNAVAVAEYEEALAEAQAKTP